MPLGFGNGFHLPSFKTGETLTKQYIINKMLGNANYGDYIPDNIQPMSLSRDFILSVSLLSLNSEQLVAFVDPTLYKNLYIISQQELSRRNINKWSNYELSINADILEKKKKFNPIER